MSAGDFAFYPNAFAANAISPNASACTVGSNCSVDVGMWVGSAYRTYGIDFKVYFNPTVLQAISVTTAGGSPYQNSPAIGDGHTSPANYIDNNTGVVFYSAMSAPGAGFTGGSPFAVATIVFQPISAGSSPLQLRPDQWINAYGPFGNGGLSTWGTVTVTGAVQVPTTTTVTFGPGPFVYTGSAFTATASVSPAAAGTATISYSGDCTNAGNTCTATATYAGNANYLPSSASTNIVIKLPVATSANQCKQGGWQFVTDDLGNLFKNQGDCVSYVATKGKNKGAGAP